MPAADFLDSNILVYAYDHGSPQKQRVARDLVRRAVAGEMVISTQVLAEFASTLTHKVSPPVPAQQLIAAIDALSPIKLVGLDADIVRRAVEAGDSYGVHFYDGMIIASAERGNCERIWSEDLNAGQRYFGVLVANPFT